MEHRVNRMIEGTIPYWITYNNIHNLKNTLVKHMFFEKKRVPGVEKTAPGSLCYGFKDCCDFSGAPGANKPLFFLSKCSHRHTCSSLFFSCVLKLFSLDVCDFECPEIPF